MKKIIIIIVIFLLSASITFAGIGENFEKGGIGLAGSIRLYFNLYYFLDDYDDRLAFSIDLFPELHFFVKDNLSILFGPFFTYENDSDGDGFGSSYISFGGLFGLEYAFVSNPDAERGRVTALGVTLQPTLIKSESDYLWVYIYLNPVFYSKHIF